MSLVDFAYPTDRCRCFVREANWVAGRAGPWVEDSAFHISCHRALDRTAQLPQLSRLPTSGAPQRLTAGNRCLRHYRCSLMSPTQAMNVQPKATLLHRTASVIFVYAIDTIARLLQTRPIACRSHGQRSFSFQR